MERKQKCESIVLSREEKKLLAEIKRHPHTAPADSSRYLLCIRFLQGLSGVSARKAILGSDAVALDADSSQHYHQPNNNRSKMVVAAARIIVFQLSCQNSFIFSPPTLSPHRQLRGIRVP